MPRRARPQPLPDSHPTGPARPRRHCRRCGRELTLPTSRLRGYGPHCDPDNHPGTTPDHDVDQDPIPGT